MEQLDEEVHRASSGKFLSTGASDPMKLGCTTSLAHRCVHQFGSSCKKEFWLRMLHYLEGLVNNGPLLLN